MITINTSGILKTLNSFSKTQRKFGQVQTQLSSGKRLNSAKDDPVGWQKTIETLSQKSGTKQANQNIGNYKSAFATASLASSQSISALQELRTLAVEASHDFLSTNERNSLGSRSDSLLGQINNIASNTRFNERNLLDGSFVSQSVQTGANEGDQIELSLPDLRSETLGVADVDLSTADQASLSITKIDQALDQAIYAQAQIGNTENQLDRTERANQTMTEVLAQNQSTLQDADFANLSAEAAKMNIQLRAQAYVLNAGLDLERSALSFLA